MTVAANHFRLAFNFDYQNLEPVQCGFTFMASDVTLPAWYATNADLPTKTLKQGYWSYASTSGAYTTEFETNDPLASLDVESQAGICELAYTFANANKAAFSGDCRLKSITITPYNENRETVGGVGRLTLTTPIGGTGGTYHPYYTSWAIGWRGSASGQSQRGRMYWPAEGATLGSSRTVASSLMSTMTSGLDTLWVQMNLVHSARAVIVHRSQQLLPPSSAYDTYSDITTLRINNMLDKMSSRGRAFPGTYTNEPISWLA